MSIKDWDTPFGPSKILEKNMSEVIYMNCPKCGAKMAKSPGICASIPPKYEFRCPQCGETVYTPRLNFDEATNDLSFSQDKIPSPKLLEEMGWDSFRREAAKDAMCAMITADTNDGIYSDPDEVCGMALLYADKLIDLLREGEERK